MAQIWEPETAYARNEDLLADPKVEAVIIAIADQFHVPTAIQAIEAGKHVLVEKPLGVSVEECNQLVNAKKPAPDLIVRVGYMKRFNPGISFARRSINKEIVSRLPFKASSSNSPSDST